MNLNFETGLTGNQLKLIALITMTIDHIGMMLFPRSALLRIIGRLAFPIFAYMIAEGCRYTRSRSRYLCSMAGLGLLCQLVYWFAMGSLYMCVLVTFSLSILLIYAIDLGREKKGLSWTLPLLVLGAAIFACVILPRMIPYPDYDNDDGIWGELRPVFAYLGTSRKDKFALTSAGLILLNRTLGGLQWYSLLALIPLYLYNGTRGKRKMKYLFYVYYPAHLVVLHGLSLIL